MTHRFSTPGPASAARPTRGLPNRLLAAGAFYSALMFMDPSPVAAQERRPADREVIFSMTSNDMAGFERNATLAKELGATHVVITNDLPPAAWEFDVKGDPYPAWFFRQPSILKFFPTPELAPFVDRDFAARVGAILEERCRILRSRGLKAVWRANEPQVLPEAFFAAHPELRGPRVDQTNRSRAPRFAPCVDQPETLRLYRESMTLLLARCPEIEVFDFLTSDSGSGFCWAPGLYPGMNGPADCRTKPMEDRVASFLANLQDAGRAAGHLVEVNIHQIEARQWMTPSFADPMLIVRKLPRGLAVDNLEGPDGRRFASSDGSGTWWGPFYPLFGIPVPTMSGQGAGAERLVVSFGDPSLVDFNVGLYRFMNAARPQTELQRQTALRGYAATIVGEDQADNLLALWTGLADAKHSLDALDFGPMLTMGHVLNRWINRPMVPFPEELKDDERAYYERFLFQAKGREQASNLADIQAMRMYEGWGAHLLFQRVIEITEPKVIDAASRASRLAGASKAAGEAARWTLLQHRIELLNCLLRSADNMVAYQAQLDRVKGLGAKPEANPVLGVRSSWDRTDLEARARNEVDNTARMLKLLEASPEPLLDLAPTPEEETIMRLGPDLPHQLRRKMEIMNSHWEDYGRLFTEPNP